MKLKNNDITIAAPLLSRLASAIEAYPEVLSGYLFGSRATGHARKDSDVDIAIRLVPGLSAEKRFQLRLEMIDRIEELVDIVVEVILMNDASLIMLNHIFSHGIAVFIRDTEAEESFKVQKQKEFFDFRHYLDRDFDQMKRYFGATVHD
jgi:predicted nucleotidyltransferase